MAQRELYIRWCQSEIVEVLVGKPDDGDARLRRFRIPMDLLGRRSSMFQTMLDGRLLGPDTGMIQIPETSSETFQNFFIWALSSAPQIESTASLETVVDLAIFATVYKVSALQNQAVDVIRTKIGSGVWQLEPNIVERVYLKVGARSMLRQLIAAALGTISKPYNSSGTGYATTSPMIQSWRKVFAKESDLGADFFVTTIMKWGGRELQGGGACRFHDHGRGMEADDPWTQESQCPLQATQCFLDVTQVTQQETKLYSKKDKKKKRTTRVEVIEPEAAPEPEGLLNTEAAVETIPSEEAAAPEACEIPPAEESPTVEVDEVDDGWSTWGVKKL